MAKLSEPIVFKALSDIQQISEVATKRAGISSPILTSADLDKLEKDRFQSFNFARGPEGGPAILEDVAEGTDEIETVDVEIPGEPEDTVTEVSSDEDEYGVED